MVREKTVREKKTREKTVKERRKPQRGKQGVDDIAESIAHFRAARYPVRVAQNAARQREAERKEGRGEVDRVEPVCFAWIGLGVLA